jgi:hypothetical protein
MKHREDRLKDIVNQVFKLDIMEKTRKREVVEARMVYSRILRDTEFMTLSKIAKSLNKNHATIVHYNKNFKYLIKPDERLWGLYLLCARIYNETDHVANNLALEECRNLIFSLENQKKLLALELSRLNLEHETYKKQNETYPKLYNLINERVRPKNVDEVTRKLNTYLNGIHN